MPSGNHGETFPESPRPKKLRFDARLAFPRFLLEADFEVNAGQTTVLVGPSGSGKTTCLNLIAGLLRPDKGIISLDTAVLCDVASNICLPPDQRRVGYLFQNYALFPHLSVRQNIAFGLRMRRIPPPDRDTAVSYWLQRLHIEELQGQSVFHLSGGQKQRVALARALAAESRCLLLDEPFNSLDISTSMSVRRELRQFLSKIALPTLVVSHDPLDAIVLGDQIVVLENGRISQAGVREELLRHPRTPFVAELAGLNLCRAVLETGSGVRRAKVCSAELHVLSEMDPGPVYLAFPPSKVRLFPKDGPAPEGKPFEGRVTDVLELPDRLLVTLDIGVPLKAELPRAAESAMKVAPGNLVTGLVEVDAIRVYR